MEELRVPDHEAVVEPGDRLDELPVVAVLDVVAVVDGPLRGLDRLLPTEPGGFERGRAVRSVGRWTGYFRL